MGRVPESMRSVIRGGERGRKREMELDVRTNQERRQKVNVPAILSPPSTQIRRRSPFLLSFPSLFSPSNPNLSSLSPVAADEDGMTWLPRPSTLSRLPTWTLRIVHVSSGTLLWKKKSSDSYLDTLRVFGDRSSERESSSQPRVR